MKTVCNVVVLVSLFLYVDCDNWQEWWTYDGISGPAYWGLMNPQWNMCSRGRRQSPVNVEPDKLLFDPYLRQIHIDKHKVSGMLYNTGQSLVFRVDKDTKQHVNISGGPLAYRYQFEEIYIHYGTENQQGSEHHIQGYSFPAEIQFYGFNKQLYHNMSEAQHKSQGIVAISLMVQIADTPNGELRLITSVFNKVQYKGASTAVKHVSLRALLPETELFMTYEGSTTHPGCWETTVWIILNKPIYITRHELYQLRKLMQGSEEAPKAPLGNNARPIQPLHQRTIRTNINFKNAELFTGLNISDYECRLETVVNRITLDSFAVDLITVDPITVDPIYQYVNFTVINNANSYIKNYGLLSLLKLGKQPFDFGMGVLSVALLCTRL